MGFRHLSIPSNGSVVGAYLRLGKGYVDSHKSPHKYRKIPEIEMSVVSRGLP